MALCLYGAMPLCLYASMQPHYCGIVVLCLRALRLLVQLAYPPANQFQVHCIVCFHHIVPCPLLHYLHLKIVHGDWEEDRLCHVMERRVTRLRFSRDQKMRVCSRFRGCGYYMDGVVGTTRVMWWARHW